MLLLPPCVALTGILPARAEAENWPAWRGPGGMGSSRETGVPRHWSRDQHIVWRIKDPGLGHSSPIVWGEALFFTTAIDTQRCLLRLDRDSGREVWRRVVVDSPLEKKHGKNSHASSTPATDGSRVFVSFLDREDVLIAAHDFDGREIWRRSPGKFYSRHGFCSSPVLFDDLVILNCDQDAYAYLVAFERANGEIRWKTDRENRVRSYCPPTMIEVAGRTQMVLSGSETVCAHDPRTGRRIWVCEGPTEQCVASIVYGKGLVFVTGGYPDREILAIDPTGTGDVTRTHIRWRARKGVSYVPSPLYLDGNFYVVSDSPGVLSCLDASDGHYRNQKRLPGNFSASLLHADGHIYAFNEDGGVFVLEADPGLETVAEIDMGDPIYATPAVSEGRLYLRTWKHLYAIGK